MEHGTDEGEIQVKTFMAFITINILNFDVLFLISFF